MLLLKIIALLVCALLIMFFVSITVAFVTWAMIIKFDPEEVAALEEKEE